MRARTCLRSCVTRWGYFRGPLAPTSLRLRGHGRDEIEELESPTRWPSRSTFGFRPPPGRVAAAAVLSRAHFPRPRAATALGTPWRSQRLSAGWGAWTHGSARQQTRPRIQAHPAALRKTVTRCVKRNKRSGTGQLWRRPPCRKILVPFQGLAWWLGFGRATAVFVASHRSGRLRP